MQLLSHRKKGSPKTTGRSTNAHGPGIMERLLSRRADVKLKPRTEPKKVEYPTFEKDGPERRKVLRLLAAGGASLAATAFFGCGQGQQNTEAPPPDEHMLPPGVPQAPQHPRDNQSNTNQPQDPHPAPEHTAGTPPPAQPPQAQPDQPPPGAHQPPPPPADHPASRGGIRQPTPAQPFQPTPPEAQPPDAGAPRRPTIRGRIRAPRGNET